MRAAFLALAWTLALPSAAQEKSAKAARPALRAPSERANYRISFKMRNHELQSSGNFVIQEGSQGNYVDGGENPFVVETPAGKGLEFKKHGTIVNCLPVQNPNTGRVRAECQFELSGPLAPVTELKANPISTFQLQTSFEVEKGKTLVLTDEADRHIEVKIEDVAP